MITDKEARDMIYHTINEYRLKVNQNVDAENMPGAIVQAENLVEYLKRTKAHLESRNEQHHDE